MLPQANRLRKKEDFNRAYRYGKSIAGQFLVLYYRSNGQGNTRIGFSVSRKIGKATVRNRVKRLIREICRKHMQEFLQGFDLIFIARPKIKGIRYALVEQEMVRLCKKAKLINGAEQC